MRVGWNRRLRTCVSRPLDQGRIPMGRAVILWLLGVPIFVIVLLAIFTDIV